MLGERRAITGSKGKELQGRKIALCITASVAAMESPRIARELMRHGADVVAVFSDYAAKLVSPELMAWATGNPVVKEITGKIEHVQLGGRGEDAVDIILIAPCTANTISKIAKGISDSAVTSLVSCAIGSRIPILIAPGMHEPMYENTIIKQNIAELKALGIRFIEPVIEEGKAKIATAEAITKVAIQMLSAKRTLAGTKFVITAGPTIERIDPIRIITNRSSGKMGVALAETALQRGADVTLVYGPGTAEPPAGAKVVRVETAEQMLSTVKKELVGADVFIAAGAPADFAPEKPYAKKLASKETLNVKLKPTQKIIDQVKKLNKNAKLVAFKAEYGGSSAEVRKKVQELFRNSKADLVVVNDVSKAGAGFGTETNEVAIYNTTMKIKKLGLASKRAIAEGIIEEIILQLKVR
ncbi:MAG: bifunctional phosphopantothenoylcysteine decarboxylase/phosphopantothenate--cysteine ligase CoaBC [Thaumarchaeota archaeon]|nr:bifunctional phosphopantothenoylcysteine decarboxylase/phosphopantothenate--cysteine ligase CoaBC [Nitrososphaerota archaeon]